MRSLSKKKAEFVIAPEIEIEIATTLNQNIANVEKRGPNMPKKKAEIEKAIEIEIVHT
jgi:hypothetical protein